ncbi:MAG TPA: SPOR domain-containing protein, partial [Dysgonamonadaceae bacterium]|nr:SPOR domain-containing protein [Dysgonamonadaceae bacterium]
ESSLFKNNEAKPTSHKSTGLTKGMTPTTILEQPVNEKTVSQPVAGNVTSQNSNNTPTDVAIKKFYIVMGVYEVRKVAEEMKAMLESEGFTQTSWLERPGRIDVYAASFTDREAADDFLKKVHSQYPHHRDAWILKY